MAACALVLAVPLAAQEKTALSLFEQGQAKQFKNDFYGAVECYREALELNGRYAEAWEQLARCTYELEEYDLSLSYADTALLYSKNYSAIQNLKGMALISLGRLDEARAVFSSVLAKYPNDIEARFGLAELNLASGSLNAAEREYSDALQRDGSSRKALLSLALVSAEMGKTAIAERYINQAMRYHSGSAQVHYLASYLASRRGDAVEAERRGRSAVQIDGDYDKAYELLAAVLYSQKRYAEVIDICDFRLGRRRNLATAWYVKALSQLRLGDEEGAIETFTSGLSVAPDDEVMRLALEQLVLETLPVEDKRRGEWAQYHIQKAGEYKRNFDGPSERFEYQRALAVDPLNTVARERFADMLYRDNFWELYLSQLKFIENNRVARTDGAASVQTDENSPSMQPAQKSAQEIKNADTIEALESMLRTNLSHQWNIDPFYLDKTRWNVGLYYMDGNVQLIHPDAEPVFVKAVHDVFNGVPTTTISMRPQAVSGYGEAYRLARSSGMDYFIILSVQEMERSFSLTADLYLARTGTKATSLHIYRTGNDRVANSLRRLRQAVVDILPMRGKVLKQSQKTLLVDVGKSDGLVKGARFDVVKKGAITTADGGTGVSYRDSDRLGTFSIDMVNEEISQGTFSKKGFYDSLNIGDEIVLVKMPEKTDEEDADGNAVADTRPAADATGTPATESAKKAEAENLKESLKAPLRETPLLDLIRSIR